MSYKLFILQRIVSDIMKNNLQIPHDKKITVVIRVEPGCLGPDGSNHIEKFCSAAQIEIESIDSGFVNWEVIPRFDKSLPEIQYKAVNKMLTHDQAVKYLELFNRKIDEFEDYMNEKLAILIDQYLGH